jgi:hypothetical protein
MLNIWINQDHLFLAPRNNKKIVQCVMSYTMSSTAGGNWESLDKKSLTVSMAEPAREEGLLHEYSEWTLFWIRIKVGSTYHPEADQDQDFHLMRMRNLYHADPDPTFNPDAVPDPDPNFQIRLKPLKKCPNRLIFHFGLSSVIFYLMRIRILIFI